MPKEKPELAARLERWRKDKGFTQQRAAEFFGVPLRTYTEAEQGEHLPRGFGKSFLLRVLAEHEAQPTATK